MSSRLHWPSPRHTPPHAGQEGMMYEHLKRHYPNMLYNQAHPKLRRSRPGQLARRQARRVWITAWPGRFFSWS